MACYIDLVYMDQLCDIKFCLHGLLAEMLSNFSKTLYKNGQLV
jgi:hypothetical protein